MVQPRIWFKEEPSQFSMGQTAHTVQPVPSWRNNKQGLMNVPESYSRALGQGTLLTPKPTTYLAADKQTTLFAFHYSQSCTTSLSSRDTWPLLFSVLRDGIRF